MTFCLLSCTPITFCKRIVKKKKKKKKMPPSQLFPFIINFISEGRLNNVSLERVPIPLMCLIVRFWGLTRYTLSQRRFLYGLIWIWAVCLSFSKCFGYIQYDVPIWQRINAHHKIIDPIKPRFYTVKMVFTGVNIIFPISAQKHRLWYSLEPPRRGGSNEYQQSMFWAEIWKLSEFFI